MKKLNIIFLFSLLISSQLFAQDTKIIKGIILDQNTKTPLSYTNIVVLHKTFGTISNEFGSFALDVTNLLPEDTLSFQYIGYQYKKLSIAQFDSISKNKDVEIYLKEEIINLSEAFVFSDPPEAKFIIEKILENKEQNYKKESVKNKTFIRSKQNSDIEHIDIKLKRNDIPGLNKKLLKLIEQKIPKHNTSYTDFLGNLYFSKKENDSLKTQPIRTVSLKEEEVSELDKIGDIFERLFKNTKEKEYWKVKTGIISQKVDVDVDDDSTKVKKDSTKEIDKNSYRTRTKYYTNRIRNKLSYGSLTNENAWEFLYKTGRYTYTLAGGTRVNGEDVYIIDFKPKKSGKYIGRVYVSINSYALIRADYQYDKGKTGTNVHLLGIGYTESNFSGSILFEKKEDNYRLKYLSKKSSVRFSFDRNVALVKKRKRFLIDKELFEIKVKFQITMSQIESTEILVLEDTPITTQEFAGFKEKKEMKVILVDQFNDQLWKGYSIIEPTKRMREYKKQESEIE